MLGEPLSQPLKTIMLAVMHMNSFSHDGCEGWGRGTTAAYNSSSKGVKTVASCRVLPWSITSCIKVYTVPYTSDGFLAVLAAWLGGGQRQFDDESGCRFSQDRNISTASTDCGSNFVSAFRDPRGWTLITLIAPWIFFRVPSWGCGFLVKCVNNCFPELTLIRKATI